MNDQNRPGYIFEETPNTMNISIHNQKDWWIFLLSILYFLSLLAIAILLVVSAISLIRGGPAPTATPGSTFLLLVFGLVLFGLYIDPIRALDNAFLQEDLAITASSVTIERSGFLVFKKKKIIPIDKIRSIRPTIQLSAQGSKLVDIFMNTLKYGKLSIITRQFIAPIYQIGRGLSPDEAITILDKILDKFPRYRYQ
jgi:hypothetical protein